MPVQPAAETARDGCALYASRNLEHLSDHGKSLCNDLSVRECDVDEQERPQHARCAQVCGNHVTRPTRIDARPLRVARWMEHWDSARAADQCIDERIANALNETHIKGQAATRREAQAHRVALYATAPARLLS